MQEVLKYIDDHRQNFVDQLVELLRFPSVSADLSYKKDVDRCAEHVRDKFKSMGFESELVETAGNPIVYAEYIRPENKRTLLIYGHYDVQPVDPLHLWNKPPFEPLIEGDTIYARGATDDKGQFLIHLLACEAYLNSVGSLPINLKFIIEGEEETASDNLDVFIKESKERLKAEGVVVSDTALYGAGIPAITYGLRGIAVAELKVVGPSRDLHSGSFGGSLINPATELARLVASMHDERHRVAIDGFYDDVRELEKWEREMFASLPFEEKEYLTSTGAQGLAGEEGYSTLERVWARPTCEVNGIFGGYQGEGGKTIIPSWAGSKITMRLVPDQRHEDILEKFERHIKKVASPAARVEVVTFGGARPAIVSRDSLLVQAGSKSLEKGFGTKPVFIREGGSIPIVNTFKQELGLDTLLLGFGRHDDNAHSPNEKFSLGDFQRGIVTVAHLLAEVK